MGTLILILLLVAAIFGVLGAVLKFALALVLGLILAFTLLVWGLWFTAKRRIRAWQRDVDRQMEENARRQRAIDVRHIPNEAERERTDGEPFELDSGDAS